MATDGWKKNHKLNALESNETATLGPDYPYRHGKTFPEDQ